MILQTKTTPSQGLPLKGEGDEESVYCGRVSRGTTDLGGPEAYHFACHLPNIENLPPVARHSVKSSRYTAGVRTRLLLPRLHVALVFHAVQRDVYGATFQPIA